ncbi:MAG: hypothetical protein M1830_007572, partial [Pleopsidium flavum]
KDKADKEFDELTQKEIDNMPLLGINVSQFPGEDTIEEKVRKMKIEDDRKQKAAAALIEPQKVVEKPLATRGPATITSRKAAATLSQPKPSSTAPERKATTTASKARVPSSSFGGTKKTLPPTNPSPMRHTAAVTASRTTMGYSKGRATSLTIKKSILPNKSTTVNTSAEVPDTTLAPAVYIQKYGIPPIGSDMWFRCNDYGCFDDDDDNVDDAFKGITPANLFMDEDESDFQLVC